MGTFKTSIRLLVIAAALTFPLAATAMAGSVLDGCNFTVTGTVAPGNTVSVQGTGFQPDAELPISVNGTIVTSVVIQDGGVLPPTDVEIPADAEYPINIEIPCSLGPGSGVATNTTDAPAGADPAALAFTGGSNTGTYVGIGFAAVVIGTVLAVGARRRSAVRTRQLSA